MNSSRLALLVTVVLAPTLAVKLMAEPAAQGRTVLQQDSLSQAATVSLKVASFNEAADAVSAIAVSSGGQILESREFVNGKGKKHGWIRLRVSAPQLGAVMHEAAMQGRLASSAFVATDNRSATEALARRITRLCEHQARLSGLLGGDRRLRGSDILFIQDRLFRAGLDEEDLAQQSVDMGRTERTGTAQIFLFEPYSVPALMPAPALSARYRESLSIAKGHVELALAKAMTVLAYSVVYAPFWLPVFIAVVLLLSWLWRRRRSVVAAVMRSATILRTFLSRRDAAHEVRGSAPSAAAATDPNG